MKKLISFVLVALFGASVLTVSAQSKKPIKSMPEKPLTVLVMDTTQALLDGADVQVGKTKFRTSYDGRVEVDQKYLTGVKALVVSRDGFESKKVEIGSTELIIVVLKSKYQKPDKSSGKDDDIYYSLSAPKGKVHASRATLAMVEEAPELDGAVSELRPMAGAAVANVSAGKLTAGEVNDFAKWYFWPKVIGDSHKEYVDTWNISANNRYTVQVMTKAGSPVTNRTVSLLDGQGNTLFQAVTDNTGKAELWANLIVGNSGQTKGLQIRVDNKVVPAKTWSEGVNTIVFEEDCDAPDGVDVVFVFDATGSMGDELRYLQAEMKDVIDRAAQATNGLAIRTGAVVYRDHGDMYLTRISRLSDDIKTTQTFIDKQEANGGGDFPEAVPEALMAALNSAGWDSEARARIAFLVLDAPCHHDSATLALLHEQVLNAAASGVRIVPVVCSGLDKAGELLMRSIALATNGTSFFLTDDSGIGHSHLKPTTDSLKVEHLNDMLVRTIVEFSLMPKCDSSGSDENDTVDEQFVPNPFSAEDIANDPSIPHGEGVHYLVDVTGKLLGVYENEVHTDFLPTGVYFIKTYVNGQWLTKKIFVR